ncbi:MAG: hypothetical protein AAF518_18925 [Spirochaetota bacterium]
MKKITKNQNYTTTIMIILALMFVSTACQNLSTNATGDDKAGQYGTILALVQGQSKSETLPSLEADPNGGHISEQNVKNSERDTHEAVGNCRNCIDKSNSGSFDVSNDGF